MRTRAGVDCEILPSCSREIPDWPSALQPVPRRPVGTSSLSEIGIGRAGGRRRDRQCPIGQPPRPGRIPQRQACRGIGGIATRRCGGRRTLLPAAWARLTGRRGLLNSSDELWVAARLWSSGIEARHPNPQAWLSVQLVLAMSGRRPRRARGTPWVAPRRPRPSQMNWSDSIESCGAPGIGLARRHGGHWLAE